jgi:hypothetical protein
MNDKTPAQVLDERKQALQEQLLPLVEAFERDTGLRVAEIGIERLYAVIGMRDTPIHSVRVRVHSL